MSGVARALVTHRRLLPVVAAGLATLLLLSYRALSSSTQPPVPEAPLRLTMNTPQWVSSPTDGMMRFKRAAAQEFTPQPQVRTFVPTAQFAVQVLRGHLCTSLPKQPHPTKANKMLQPPYDSIISVYADGAGYSPLAAYSRCVQFSGHTLPALKAHRVT